MSSIVNNHSQESLLQQIEEISHVVVSARKIQGRSFIAYGSEGTRDLEESRLSFSQKVEELFERIAGSDLIHFSLKERQIGLQFCQTLRKVLPSEAAEDTPELIPDVQEELFCLFDPKDPFLRRLEGQIQIKKVLLLGRWREVQIVPAQSILSHVENES